MLARTLAVLLFILPLGAQAQDTSISASEPYLLANVMEGMGFRTTVGTDSFDDPIIYSSFNGYDFEVVFYGCTNNVDCQTVLFAAHFNGLDGRVSPASVMEYNRGSRWGRAYLQDDLDATLEMDVNLIGGVPRRNFEASLDFWTIALQEFSTYLPY